jgi:hypothetical protein
MVKIQGFAALNFEKNAPLSIFSLESLFFTHKRIFYRKKFARSEKRPTLTHNYSITLAHTLLNLNNTRIQNEQILLHFCQKERVLRAYTEGVLALAADSSLSLFCHF